MFPERCPEADASHIYGGGNRGHYTDLDMEDCGDLKRYFNGKIKAKEGLVEKKIPIEVFVKEKNGRSHKFEWTFLLVSS